MFDHFDLLAPLYDTVIGPPDPARLRELLRLPAAGRMLDAGGGTGRIAALLHGMVDQLVVSDVSLPMLRKAQPKGGFALTQAHIERLPFPDDCFERIMVVDSLHHFPDAQATIAELVRVLKPGGRLVIEEPDIAHPIGRAVALAERVAMPGSTFYPHVAIRDMVAAHPLSVSTAHDGASTLWVMADKP